MQFDIINSNGEQTGRSMDLPDDIFNITPNDHVIYLSVKQYLAAQRQGNAKTKTRAEVKGSSRKLHRQKGTGGSRKGNIRNPLYKGGGAINGPVPHGYDFKLNRKVKDLAKMSALSYKAQEGKIVVMEDPTLEMPNTKQVAKTLAIVTSNARRSLIITDAHYPALHLSTRNIQNVKSIVLSDMNTYDLVNATCLVFTESAANMFVEHAEELIGQDAAVEEVKATVVEAPAEAEAKELSTEAEGELAEA